LNKTPEQFPQIDSGLVNKIVLVDLVTRDIQTSFQSSSLPGHLIHLVVKGQVEQRWGPHTQQLAPGDIVWYYEDEIISGEITSAPWSFYTVNFIAPALNPPLFEERVRRGGPTATALFETLLTAWRKTTISPMLRHLSVHARLLDLLAYLMPKQSDEFQMNSTTELWWRVESKLRQNLGTAMNLNTLENLSGASSRTLNRACQRATAMSPMQRLKQIRLSYAKGLLLYSKLSISEIAYSIAYNRSQEFSRDYHRHYGITPTQERRSGNSYRIIES